MPTPSDPDIFNFSMGAVSDASIIALTNYLLDKIETERGIDISQAWRDGFYNLAIDAVLAADPLWTAEAVSAVILDALNEPYEGSPPREGQPIYLPTTPIEGTPLPQPERKLPAEPPTKLPVPSIPVRLPSPTLPQGETSPPSGGNVPPERKPPVESPPTSRKITIPRVPEITTPTDQIPGLSEEDKKRIDDINTKIDEETKKLEEEIKKIAEEQKKQSGDTKTVNPVDLEALGKIILAAVKQWWEYSKAYRLHGRTEDEPDNEIARKDAIKESTDTYSELIDSMKKFPVPQDTTPEIDYPFTL